MWSQDKNCDQVRNQLGAGIQGCILASYWVVNVSRRVWHASINRAAFWAGTVSHVCIALFAAYFFHRRVSIGEESTVWRKGCMVGWRGADARVSSVEYVWCDAWCVNGVVVSWDSVDDPEVDFASHGIALVCDLEHECMSNCVAMSMSGVCPLLAAHWEREASVCSAFICIAGVTGKEAS